MSKILVILTGGTIACENTDAGLVPLKGKEYFINILKYNTRDGGFVNCFLSK